MAAITIRNLDDDVKVRLRLAAARNGVSMEEQARRLLTSALSTDGQRSTRPLGQAIHELFADLGGNVIDVPDRQELPRAASFEP